MLVVAAHAQAHRHLTSNHPSLSGETGAGRTDYLRLDLEITPDPGPELADLLGASSQEFFDSLKRTFSQYGKFVENVWDSFWPSASGQQGQHPLSKSYEEWRKENSKGEPATPHGPLPVVLPHNAPLRLPPLPLRIPQRAPYAHRGLR